jgi:hypothetical protein
MRRTSSMGRPMQGSGRMPTSISMATPMRIAALVSTAWAARLAEGGGGGAGGPPGPAGLRARGARARGAQLSTPRAPGARAFRPDKKPQFLGRESERPPHLADRRTVASPPEPGGSGVGTVSLGS